VVGLAAATLHLTQPSAARPHPPLAGVTVLTEPGGAVTLRAILGPSADWQRPYRAGQTVYRVRGRADGVGLLRLGVPLPAALLLPRGSGSVRLIVTATVGRRVATTEARLVVRGR